MGGFNAIDLDVVDLYYSLPHDTLLKAVKSCIQDDNDEIRFRNDCGVSVESFLELLSMYLKATVVAWGDKQLI